MGSDKILAFLNLRGLGKRFGVMINCGKPIMNNLKLLTLILLLSVNAACIQPSPKIGMVFLASSANTKNYRDEIQKVMNKPNLEILKLVYTCDEAKNSVKEILKEVRLLFSAKEDNCDLQPLLDENKFPASFHIVLEKDKFAEQIQQGLESLEKKPSTDSQKTFTVKVPFAPLRERPEKPYTEPSANNRILVQLKEGEKVTQQETTADKTETRCKQDQQKGLIYDGIYTRDWMCVALASDSSKVGWIHKLLVK
jgi:hypothetical protein